MKKAGSRVSEPLVQYDARFGIRGKYVSPHDPTHLDQEALTRVWAPLVGFHWRGKEMQVLPDTWIRRTSDCPLLNDFPGIKPYLSEADQETWSHTRHTLHFTQARDDEASIKAKMNAFLLTLWLLKPTRTHIALRLEVTDSSLHSLVRVLERIQWIEGQTRARFYTNDLEALGPLLDSMHLAYKEGRRLRNALALTLRGCLASEWQSAFVCFTTAAECILTYSTDRGLTDRLSQTYARLVCRDGRTRQAEAAAAFRRAYSVRSDIVHGRAYARTDTRKNLAELIDFSNMLRRLWRKVLADPDARPLLDGSDAQRQRFLGAL